MIKFIKGETNAHGFFYTNINKIFQIDLIVPTNVQAVVLHGWHQQEHQVFINKFIIEYGVKKTNLSFYTEENEQPKVGSKFSATKL